MKTDHTTIRGLAIILDQTTITFLIIIHVLKKSSNFFSLNQIDTKAFTILNKSSGKALVKNAVS